MKLRNHTLIICAAAIFVLINTQCKKDKVLPAETQTGAGTFGCLIDGRVFVPRGNPFSGVTHTCYYQFVDGEFYFQVGAKDLRNTEKIESVTINIAGFSLKIGTVIPLAEAKDSVAGEGRYVANGNVLNPMKTTKTNYGELVITKFDEINQIVSGTFWFNVEDTAGNKFNITDGRFDMIYTR